MTKAEREAIAWAYALCRTRCYIRVRHTAAQAEQTRLHMNRLATMCGDSTIWFINREAPGYYIVLPAVEPET